MITQSKKPVQGRRSALQKKVLLLLYGGIALGLTRNPNQYFRVVREVAKEWGKIDRISLNRAIQTLYNSKLVATKDNDDGTTTLVLSKNGEHLALTYNIDNMEIKPQSKWDGRWRIVMFDVPERKRHTRNAIRSHFKNMGFYEFQKSVFVHPFPCTKEIDYIIEFYNMRRHIRFTTAIEIDNAIEIKRRFNLA